MKIKNKGYFESDGKTKIGSQRKIHLQQAFVMGAKNDIESFTRLIIESRVSRQLLNEQFGKGKEIYKRLAQ